MKQYFIKENFLCVSPEKLSKSTYTKNPWQQRNAHFDRGNCVMLNVNHSDACHLKQYFQFSWHCLLNTIYSNLYKTYVVFVDSGQYSIFFLFLHIIFFFFFSTHTFTRQYPWCFYFWPTDKMEMGHGHLVALPSLHRLKTWWWLFPCLRGFWHTNSAN